MDKDQGAQDKDKKDLPNGDDVIGTGNDARLKMLAQINDQNDAAAAKGGDLADVNDDGTTGEFKPEITEPKEEDDGEATRLEAEKAAQEAAKNKDEPPAQKFKIKVNGKELELTQQELIERAQKVEAADEYLKDAAKRLREAEGKSAGTDAQPSDKDVADAELERRRALVRAIQMGTEDEAMAAIEELQSRTVPSVTTDDVARTVDERLTFNDAVTWFQSEYKDLVEDPVLLGIVLQRDKELLAQGDKRGYRERYEAVGKEVRAWKEEMVKAAIPPEPAKPDNSKETRKAAAPTVPQGAGTKAPAAVDDEDKEESVGEVISAMAKARGGPQWLRG